MENLDECLGKERVVVWFGNFGVSKSAIEKKGFDPKCFEYSLVVNEASVIRAAAEIKNMISYDGWDKYYVCRDMDLAKRLLAECKTKEFLDHYKDGCYEDNLVLNKRGNQKWNKVKPNKN